MRIRRRIAAATALAIGSTVLVLVPIPASAAAPSYRADTIPLTGAPGSTQSIALGAPAVMVGLRYLGIAERGSIIRVDTGGGLGKPIKLDDRADDAPEPAELVRHERAKGASTAEALATSSTLTSYTTPTWVKAATRVEVTIPVGVVAPELVVIRQDGTSKVPTSRGVAGAATGQPNIVTRAQWGSRSPSCEIGTSPVLKMAFVHHTAGTNTYSLADAPNVVRAVQAFHMDGRNWCDIGYNFLVDRFGTGTRGGRAASAPTPSVPTPPASTPVPLGSP